MIFKKTNIFYIYCQYSLTQPSPHTTDRQPASLLQYLQRQQILPRFQVRGYRRIRQMRFLLQALFDRWLKFANSPCSTFDSGASQRQKKNAFAAFFAL